MILCAGIGVFVRAIPASRKKKRIKSPRSSALSRSTVRVLSLLRILEFLARRRRLCTPARRLGDGGRRALRRQPRAAHAHLLPRAVRARLPGPSRRRHRRRRRAPADVEGHPGEMPPPRRRPRRPRRPAPRCGRGVRAEHPGDVRATLRGADGGRRHLRAQLAPGRRHGRRPAAALGGQGNLRRRRAARRRAGSPPPRLRRGRQGPRRRPHRGAPRRLCLDIIFRRNHDGARVRGSCQRRVGGVRGAVAGGRERADRAQLHVGHDVAAQGRDLHPPRRVPQQPRRRAAQRHAVHAGVPVDGAHVPLQRLVHVLGRGGAGRHQRLPPQGHRRRHLRRRRAARGDAHGRCAHRALHDRQRRAGGQAAASRGEEGERDDRRRASAADGAVPDGGAGVPGDPLVRAHGDVRPRHGVRVEARVGRAAGGRAGGDQGAAGAPPPGAGGGREGPGDDADRPGGRPDDGGGDVPWQHGDERVLQGHACHGGGLRRRVVPVGGPGGAEPRGRVREDQGPVQGHHHLRRGEHQHDRGGGGAVRAPGGGGGGRGGAAGRALGGDAVRVRGGEGGGCECGGGDRVLQGEAAAVHGAEDGGGGGGAAQDGDGEGAEVCAPGEGEGHGKPLLHRLPSTTCRKEQALSYH